MSSLPHDDDGLIRYRDARALGRSAQLQAALTAGRVRRVSRGIYSIDRAAAGPGAAETAYRENVLAAGRRMSHPIFTAFSAASLYRLPLLGPLPAEVYVMSTGPHGKRRPGVISLARRCDVGACEVSGLFATPVEFTLIQLARHGSLRQGLVAADAALFVPRVGDREPLTTPERLWGEWQRMFPFHGAWRAKAVLDRMSTLAETPLETVSRVVIEELGFAAPRLQQRFWLPGLDRAAWTDFYWPDVGIVGEADGRIKYRSSSDAGGSVEALVAEKEREDELRLQVRGVARWGWTDVWNPHRLESILLRAGVPRVQAPVRL